jgi:Na+(H+)/acetate symporter ActP
MTWMADKQQEVNATRWATVAIGALPIGLVTLPRGLNVAGRAALALPVAASANLRCSNSLFWKRFITTRAPGRIPFARFDHRMPCRLRVASGLV